MPRALSVLALPLLLLLAACGGDAGTADPVTLRDGEAVQPAEPAEALGSTVRMEGGVQVAEVTAGRTGYAPATLELTEGVPARLVFTRTVESACSSQIQIPAFDVPVTDLPLNEPVAIEFTPTQSGDFEFVCGMDMQRGSLMVRS